MPVEAGASAVIGMIAELSAAEEGPPSAGRQKAEFVGPARAARTAVRVVLNGRDWLKPRRNSGRLLERV
jgi:hypothetical protein